jgi:hypothetical protein
MSLVRNLPIGIRRIASYSVARYRSGFGQQSEPGSKWGVAQSFYYVSDRGWDDSRSRDRVTDWVSHGSAYPDRSYSLIGFRQCRE